MDQPNNAALYANEIATFNLWYLDHNWDSEIFSFMEYMFDDNVYNNMSHSQRWSECYDFLDANFNRSDLATGMAYWIEKTGV